MDNEYLVIKQWLINGAIISLSPGRLLLGWGERSHFASAKEASQRSSFYFPDFFLKEKYPWFQYENTQEIEAENLLRLLCAEETTLEATLSHSSRSYTWENNFNPLFCRTFNDLKQKMTAGELVKAVPFIFETSTSSMTASQLIQSICNSLKYMSKHPAYLYGFWDQTEGMLGLTPEILFRSKEGRQLETMACAGTCGKEVDIQQFFKDPKEAKEHQWVVQGINNALKNFGTVHIGERQILSLPTLNHLITSISVELHSALNFDKIVSALHPTPALGAFPRLAGMRWLESYQQHINRRRFGAPVAYLKEDGVTACYVAIRNVQWDQAGMLIGAGCGIVATSQMDSEWKEINLKLKAIKEMLRLI
ncbi:MAG: chorismate-binding protein [Parachlamydiaceae bacterium]|nr:chorismate-binding protein [Parachlamydiaceae bacterium]